MKKKVMTSVLIYKIVKVYRKTEYSYIEFSRGAIGIY